MDSIIQIFPENNKGASIQIIYSAENGMIAEEMGQAILGMKMCLDVAIKLLQIDEDVEIVVFPIEKGSQKTIFAIVKKNAWKAIIAADLIINLVNGGLNLIDRVGVNQAFHSTPFAIEKSQNLPLKTVELCRSRDFISGAQKVVYPLKEEVKTLTIKYDERTLSEIKCESRSKFFEEIDQEKVFPEWKDGDLIKIQGEITRINKTSKSLGFSYRNITLDCHPESKEQNIMDWHYLMPKKEVLLTGIVQRENEFKKPEIKILNVEEIEIPQTLL